MKKILIIFGGNSFEHDISCLSVNNVLKNIDKKKYIVDLVGISKNNDWFLINNEEHITPTWELLAKKKINNIIEFIKGYNIIFPVMHGANGEDGRIQGFFEMFNINYLGSNSSASHIAMDKYLTKILCEKNNIPQVQYYMLKNDKNIPENIEFPVIVKPAKGGSSIGITIAHSKNELKKCINNALKYDEKVLIEKFIDCRELECAILENKELIVSTVGEINSCNEFYDFEAKYEKKSEVIIPAKIKKKTIKEIQDLSKKIFKLLGLKDFARIDFLYDNKNDIIYFNEVNTIPGFTDISMFPLLFKNKKLDFRKIIAKLIEH